MTTPIPLHRAIKQGAFLGGFNGLIVMSMGGMGILLENANHPMMRGGMILLIVVVLFVKFVVGGILVACGTGMIGSILARWLASKVSSRTYQMILALLAGSVVGLLMMIGFSNLIFKGFFAGDWFWRKELIAYGVWMLLGAISSIAGVKKLEQFY